MSHDHMFMLARDRARYDALLTWAQGVIGRQDGETLADMQMELIRRATETVKGNDDEAKVFAVLAEIGFAAVIDSMLAIINNHADGGSQ